MICTGLFPSQTPWGEPWTPRSGAGGLASHSCRGAGGGERGPLSPAACRPRSVEGTRSSPAHTPSHSAGGELTPFSGWPGTPIAHGFSPFPGHPGCPGRGRGVCREAGLLLGLAVPSPVTPAGWAVQPGDLVGAERVGRPAPSAQAVCPVWGL